MILSETVVGNNTGDCLPNISASKTPTWYVRLCFKELSGYSWFANTTVITAPFAGAVLKVITPVVPSYPYSVLAKSISFIYMLNWLVLFGIKFWSGVTGDFIVKVNSVSIASPVKVCVPFAPYETL